MADSVFGELTAAWKAATDGWLWLFTSLQSSVLGNLLLLWLGWAVLAAVLGRRRQLLHRAGLLKRLLPASYGGAGTAFPKRWAVVTGGAQGIGRAFVAELAADGWSLVVVDLPGEKLDAAVAEAIKIGATADPSTAVSVVAVGCDVSEVDVAVARVARAVAEATADGPLLLLVNNVGISTTEPTLFVDHSVETVSSMVQVNAHFTARITHELLPRIAVRARLGKVRGGVLFVSSAASLIPAPYVAVYSATKAFINTLARTLRSELAPEPVDVLAVAPGYVLAGNTPRWVGASDNPGLTTLASPAEVARASTLLLPTANTHLVHPMLGDAATAMLTAVLPESLVSAVVLHRHRAQRKRLLVLDANPTAPSDSVRGIESFLSPPG